MADRIIAPRTYCVVCALLILLTILTVGVSFAPLEQHWHIVLGLCIGAIKASLVALFFMHVLHSPRLTWIVIAVVLFWVVILFGMTLTDYFTRDMVPFTPGH